MIHFAAIPIRSRATVMASLKLNTDLPEIDDYEALFLDDRPLLDVRAPVEFAEGAFPHADNQPLIDDLERHQVGTLYKEQGQDAAVVEGLKLVSGDLKQQRITAWETFVRRHPEGALYCFRGGMRSKITQQWLYEATGIAYPRVRGGYKALRRFLIDQLAENAALMHPVVIGGRTGVGKTHFIKQLSPYLDLEGLAWHRGSAFGRHATPQPPQIGFENALSIELLRLVKKGNPWFAAEDESRNIGGRHIPMEFFEHFSKAPVVVLETDLSQRIDVTLQEYVEDTLAEYVAIYSEDEGWSRWTDSLRDSLYRIRKRLGGEDYQRISTLLEDALALHERSGSTEGHRGWIEALLVDYYDAMYNYQLQQKQNRIQYTGDIDSVQEYLLARFKIEFKS